MRKRAASSRRKVLIPPPRVKPLVSLSIPSRRHGLHPVEIAETPFSRILGIARREKWEELGEPPRPEHPPRRYLVPHGEVMIEPRESIDGRAPGTFREKEAARDERYRADARAQLEWEAQARRDYERRRDSGAEY